MAERNDHYKREEDEEEEEEEELDENYYKAQKDALLFAINVSPSMLKDPPPSEDKKAIKDNAVIAALKSAHQVMQQRIISNAKDMMGIILFGTEKTKYVDFDGKPSNLSYPHCYVYTPLDVPAAEDVKQLRSFVHDGDDEDQLLVPSPDGVDIKDLLFCANQIFTQKAPNFGSRRLFIITDNDDPHPGDKSASESARTRAQDLYDLGVNIEVFPITHGEDSKFDLTKFYDNIVYPDPTSEALDSERFNTSKSGDLNSLIKNITSKQTPKRAYFSNMTFELGPGLNISVKGYNIIQKQSPARSCYIWLDGETAQMAVSETTRMAEDTTRTVSTGEVKKAYKFGGEYVYFSPEEQKEVKQFGSSTIRIIGFKDRSLLKFWMSMKKSVFIYPSEEGYIGSTRVFSALWKKLLKSGKIGIAWHVSRTNANPVLVAVIPSRAQDDEDSGTPFLPAGLWLYPIPFADDVRPPPGVKTVRTTDELTNQMNKIVRVLQLPNAAYDPTKYPNPSLQWHYRILQALALEEEVPDEPDDKTKPKTKAIHKRVGGHIEDWSNLADQELTKYEEQQGIKRELEHDDEPRPAKKAKKTIKAENGDGGSVMNDAALKKKFNSGELTKLKVVDLKDILAAHGLDTKGKKAELVERLEQWVEDNL
ncbi:hypothetical protein JX265_003412 [Neoarthrinium moseri]|uniref:ATP-dependent DNA helicase II subunit 1 n=1 Tax=Neoarthrinium moseri TaxID=1658444 RepID=A0A9P9WS51_9PEZI|nr:hypothetical protein JX266_004417 [Neoarthrinium moseri]KAI1877404.1 hypothetical protein JX265_003412 [Neoarthrinium moseri]